jgi:spermidine synthase
MQKYDGVLIHRTEDRDGIIEVVEGTTARSMRFGTSAKQSCMSLIDPNRLELPYIRAMLSCLLFNSDPQTVLIVGLGGGSGPATASVTRRIFG